MPIRNTHRVGSFLVLDDESGFVHYSDEVRTIWDGSIRHERMFETRQPQEFVYARSDPQALFDIRPEPRAATPFTSELLEIGGPGGTGLSTPTAPASHLFDPAIPDMEIGKSWRVK